MPDLPDIGTDAGVLARLMIAETHNPNFPDYNEDDAKLSFRFMQAVVNNRLNNNPAQFGAPGATTLTDIITAPNQFDGFSKVAGQVQISPGIAANIDDVMRRANTGAPGPFAQFVQDILTRVNSPVDDPQAGVMSINGIAVQGGTYGWKTAGAASPGPRFFAIPPELGGVLMGNQFYALLQSTDSFDQTVSMNNMTQRGMEQLERLMQAVVTSAPPTPDDPAKRFWFPRGVDLVDATVKFDLKDGFSIQLKLQGPTGSPQSDQ
jgi:hypothetical protein